MRQIGVIANPDDADRFADFLRAEGTVCSVDSSPDGYRIWVQDDDQVPAAKEEFPRFLAAPNHERYRDAARRAVARFSEERDRRIAQRPKVVNLSEKWSRPVAENCPITFGLIAVSCIVGYLTKLNPQFNDPRFEQLWISTDDTIDAIMHGEVWRLITPIFLHRNLMHILFNMLMTMQFGMQIESRKGSAKFLGIVLVTAVLSNFAQFWFSGPNFGGMSGVVYGLFGYSWIKGKLEPESGLGLPQQTVMTMLVWYVLCTIGVIPRVANWAHGVGLLTGVTIAFSHSLIRRLK